MQSGLESLSALVALVTSVITLAVISVTGWLVVKMLKTALSALERLVEELMATRVPTQPFTYSTSTSAPSQAKPVEEPTTSSSQPAPAGAMEVTCKLCHKTSRLEPVRSEIKGDKTILKFICENCGGEFGRLVS